MTTSHAARIVCAPARYLLVWAMRVRTLHVFVMIIIQVEQVQRPEAAAVVAYRWWCRAVATTFVSKLKQAKDLLTLLRFTDITKCQIIIVHRYILLCCWDEVETMWKVKPCAFRDFVQPPDRSVCRSHIVLSTAIILWCIVAGDTNRPVYFVGLRCAWRALFASQPNTWTWFGKATVSIPLPCAMTTSCYIIIVYIFPFFFVVLYCFQTSASTTLLWTPEFHKFSNFCRTNVPVLFWWQTNWEILHENLIEIAPSRCVCQKSMKQTPIDCS